MSSYSKCRFCGNVDYADFSEPRMCGQCSISYLAGEENAEERIIKLLEDSYLLGEAHPNYLAKLIALIKGEQK